MRKLSYHLVDNVPYVPEKASRIFPLLILRLVFLASMCGEKTVERLSGGCGLERTLRV